jgi:hypothetical protein
MYALRRPEAELPEGAYSVEYKLSAGQTHVVAADLQLSGSVTQPHVLARK